MNSGKKVVGLMQPYFFPYIGYFQLMSACDEFLFYDDVQFKKQGWINRNRIYFPGNEGYKYITIPVKKSSITTKINEICVSAVYRKENILNQIFSTYRGAPFFDAVYGFLDEALDFKSDSLSDCIIDTLESCVEFIGIDVELKRTSLISMPPSNGGQDRVIDLCKNDNASIYINPLGGASLYQSSDFKENGIELCFLKPATRRYKQFSDEFVPSLSIIDVLMFNSIDDISEMIDGYEIIKQ